MDGKGRWADNIVMERFWRTYEHEFFLQRDPRSLEEAMEMTAEWLEYYKQSASSLRSEPQWRRYKIAPKKRIDIRGVG